MPDTKYDKLEAKGKQRIRSILGAFLFYGRAVEQPILLALNEITTIPSQPNHWRSPEKKTNGVSSNTSISKISFLCWINAIVHRVRCHLPSTARDKESNCRIVLSTYPSASPQSFKNYKAPIHVECSTIKNVVSSEYGDLSLNCWTAMGIYNTLNGMGYSQERPLVTMDNSTANIFSTLKW